MKMKCNMCGGSGQVPNASGKYMTSCMACFGTGYYGQDEKKVATSPSDRKGCFTASTLIRTPTGEIPIGHLQCGDMVESYDLHSGETRDREVLRVKKHLDHFTWMIKFTDGTNLTTTRVHSFLVNDRWQKAASILPRDTIATSDSSGHVAHKTVETSSPTGISETVFNIVVDRDFCFFADGVLAHSFTYLRHLRSAGWLFRNFVVKRLGAEIGETEKKGPGGIMSHRIV